MRETKSGGQLLMMEVWALPLYSTRTRSHTRHMLCFYATHALKHAHIVHLFTLEYCI